MEVRDLVDVVIAIEVCAWLLLRAWIAIWPVISTIVRDIRKLSRRK